MPAIDLNKEKNPVPAPKLGSVETILVTSHVVICDGGEGEFGHPRVWLRIEGHQTYCPYCSRQFILNPGSTDTSEH